MSVTAFPSMSVGDMVTAPVAVASSDTSNCSSPLPISGISLASALFLLEEREDEDPVNLDTVTREDGLGDSFSLKQEEKMMLLESMLLQQSQQPNLIQVSLSTHPTHGAYSKYWLWWHPHDKVLDKTCAPVFLSLQQFPVCIDLHIQSQLHIQQLLVFTELSVHPVSQFSHFLFFCFDGTAVLVSLRRQNFFQLSDTIFWGSHLQKQTCRHHSIKTK